MVKKYLLMIFALYSLSFSKALAQSSSPLTKEQVRRYIKTEIEIGRLQMKMKAHADQYDSLIRTFYNRRKVLLKNRGWEVEEFENIEGRIMGAVSALEDLKNAKEEKKNTSKSDFNLEEAITQIREDDFLSEEYKEKLISRLKKANEQLALQKVDQQLAKQKKEWHDRSRPDWPAVRPYLAALDQLTNWYAGNISAPPDIK